MNHKTITYDTAMWQLVPKVTTDKMDGVLQWFDRGSPKETAAGWLKVLAAAPSAHDPHLSDIEQMQHAKVDGAESWQEGLTDAVIQQEAEAWARKRTPPGVLVSTMHSGIFADGMRRARALLASQPVAPVDAAVAWQDEAVAYINQNNLMALKSGCSPVNVFSPDCKREGDSPLFARPPVLALTDWPEEPTDAMQAAGAGAIRFDTTILNKIFTANAVYRAMRAAVIEVAKGGAA